MLIVIGKQNRHTHKFDLFFQFGIGELNMKNSIYHSALEVI